MHLFCRVRKRCLVRVIRIPSAFGPHLENVIGLIVRKNDQDSVLRRVFAQHSSSQTNREAIPVRARREKPENVPVVPFRRIIPENIDDSVSVERTERGYPHRYTAPCQAFRDHVSLRRHNFLPVQLGCGRIQKQIDRNVIVRSRKEPCKDTRVLQIQRPPDFFRADSSCKRAYRRILAVRNQYVPDSFCQLFDLHPVLSALRIIYLFVLSGLINTFPLHLSGVTLPQHLVRI